MAKQNIYKHYSRATLIIALTLLFGISGGYMVQSILVLYCTKIFYFTDAHAYLFTSATIAMFLASPIIGSYVANYWLGYKRAITTGLILIIVSMLILSIAKTSMLYMGLAISAIALGLICPCSMTLLSQLYEKNDPRRNSSFLFVYLCWNMGGAAAMLLGGIIVKKLGFSAAFLFEVIFTLIALLIFLPGQKHFPVEAKKLKHKTIGYSIILICIPALILLFHYPNVCNELLLIIGLLTITGIIITAFCNKTTNRNKYLIFIFLFTIIIIYETITRLPPTLITVFTDRNVNRHFWHWLIPTSSILGIASIYYILLSPIVHYFWKYLNQHNKNLSSTANIAIGIILVGPAYLILILGIHLADIKGYSNLIWLMSYYGMLTLGSLFTASVSLAIIGRLVPRDTEGIMMGITIMLVNGIPTVLSGYLANYTSAPQGITDPKLTNPIFAHHFSQFGFISIAIGIIMILSIPILSRLSDDY